MASPIEPFLRMDKNPLSGTIYTISMKDNVMKLRLVFVEDILHLSAGIEP